MVQTTKSDYEVKRIANILQTEKIFYGLENLYLKPPTILEENKNDNNNDDNKMDDDNDEESIVIKPVITEFDGMNDEQELLLNEDKANMKQSSIDIELQ